MDEEKARAQKWCIDSVTGNVRRCTDPKEDAKKAKQDPLFIFSSGFFMGFFVGHFGTSMEGTKGILW